MTFLLSKILWGLLQPFNLIIVLVLLWPALTALGWPRAGTLSVKSALVMLVTAAILPIGQMLLIPLESRFPRPDPFPTSVTGILVLGGGLEPDITAARGIVSFTSAAARMTEALALARRYPEAKLVFTGGSAEIIGPKYREADGARQFFAEEGLAEGRVIYEDASRNTVENVLNTKALLHPVPGERWLLVTSAYHMPRSVGIFRRAGWPVIPDPVDYRTKGQIGLSFRLLSRFEELDVAVKEWVGLAAYSAMGRTSSLFPAPG